MYSHCFAELVGTRTVSLFGIKSKRLGSCCSTASLKRRKRLRGRWKMKEQEEETHSSPGHFPDKKQRVAAAAAKAPLVLVGNCLQMFEQNEAERFLLIFQTGENTSRANDARVCVRLRVTAAVVVSRQQE